MAQAAPQDVVLIAGKGHEAWQEIAGERIEFSDKTHALRGAGKEGPRHDRHEQRPHA